MCVLSTDRHMDEHQSGTYLQFYLKPGIHRKEKRSVGMQWRRGEKKSNDANESRMHIYESRMNMS